MLVKIQGGLGNQMFIYSFAYALTQKNKIELILDTENYDIYTGPLYMLDYFQIQYKERLINWEHAQGWSKIYKAIRYVKILLNGYKVYKEKESFALDPYLLNQPIDKLLLVGYWQNYRYFDQYRNEIIEQFKLKKIRKELLCEISKIDKNEVALHVRRDDYKTYLGGKCLDIKYYRNAMKLCMEENPNSIFCIFTDDINYCKDVFKDYPTKYIMDNRKFLDIEEMILMSNYSRMIIANSTFSWWAAYLNKVDNKKIYAPVVDRWGIEFYPDTWIKIETELDKMSENK